MSSFPLLRRSSDLALPSPRRDSLPLRPQQQAWSATPVARLARVPTTALAPHDPRGASSPPTLPPCIQKQPFNFSHAMSWPGSSNSWAAAAPRSHLKYACDGELPCCTSPLRRRRCCEGISPDGLAFRCSYTIRSLDLSRIDTLSLLRRAKELQRIQLYSVQPPSIFHVDTDRALQAPSEQQPDAGP